MKNPLDGIKILDFSYLLPGPYGTMIMSDMGADIIKVENPAAPDMMRYIPPIIDNISAVYSHVNRGKKSLTLNLKKENAREIIYRLVEDYDIVIEQFRPGVMKRLGLGYEDLKKINKSIIYCSLTGYGQKGEYAQKAGHDINYMALSGVESISGRSASGPSLSGIQIADIAGGSKNLVIGILSAYIKREKTGKGDFIDISITDSVFSMSIFSSSGYLAGANEPSAESEILNGGAIYDFYPTSDSRYISVGPIEEKFMKNFFGAVGMAEPTIEMISEPGSMKQIKSQVGDIIKKFPLDYWIKKFEKVDACVEPVLALSESTSRPPLSDREMIVQVKTRSGIPLKQIGNPIKFKSGHYYSGEPGVPPGFNNDEILQKAGYSESDISRFKGEGII